MRSSSARVVTLPLFRATADGLEVGRGRLASLPLPAFVQSTALDRCRDLVAFVGENGRFVAEASDALKRHGAEISPGVFQAEALVVDQALAATDTERLGGLEQTLVDRGVDPEVAAAIAAEVAAALRDDPTLSFAAATRAGFAAHQGISLDEAARAERAFTLSPPEAAAVLNEHFDEIAGRSDKGDQITIEDLHDAIDDESLDPAVRDVAYRLAADGVLFTNLDVAHQTDLSDEPLGNGFAWHEADGIIGRDDAAEFAAKDHQARVLLAWHPLVETAGQGYDLARVDSHARADDVTAFVEDEDIPAYVRFAVFDVYAERHGLTVSEREVLEQELAFDGTTYGGGGTYLDVSRGPNLARTTPVAPGSASTRRTMGGSGGGGGGAAAAVYAQVLVAAAGFGWNQGRRARIARDGDPAIVHTDPLTGVEASVDPTELAHLSPAEAKAYVAYFAVHRHPATRRHRSDRTPPVPRPVRPVAHVRHQRTRLDRTTGPTSPPAATYSGADGPVDGPTLNSNRSTSADGAGARDGGGRFTASSVERPGTSTSMSSMRDGDIYVQDEGRFVYVLSNGNGTSSVVILEGPIGDRRAGRAATRIPCIGTKHSLQRVIYEAAGHQTELEFYFIAKSGADIVISRQVDQVKPTPRDQYPRRTLWLTVSGQPPSGTGGSSACSLPMTCPCRLMSR